MSRRARLLDLDPDLAEGLDPESEEGKVPAVQARSTAAAERRRPFRGRRLHRAHGLPRVRRHGGLGGDHHRGGARPRGRPDRPGLRLRTGRRRAPDHRDAPRGGRRRRPHAPRGGVGRDEPCAAQRRSAGARSDRALRSRHRPARPARTAARREPRRHPGRLARPRRGLRLGRLHHLRTRPGRRAARRVGGAGHATGEDEGRARSGSRLCRRRSRSMSTGRASITRSSL